MRSRLIWLLLLAFAVLGPTSATAARPFGAAQYLSEVTSLGAQSGRAHAIVFAPDRSLWFAGAATNYGPAFGIAGSIGPIERAEPPRRTEPAAKELALGEPLDGIAAGPDGNLWITSSGGDKILRMTPAGSITTIAVGAPGSATASLAGPTGIVAAPDGSVWFAAETGDGIGRIDTTGAVTAYPLAPGAAPHAITIGADGRLWFTESGAAEVGAITTGGTVTAYPLPNPKARPNGIVAGPGGTIWFTESNSPRIGRVAPSGQVTEFPAEAAGPIVFGPDRDLWFGSRNGIGSISPRGILGSTFCLDSCQADVEALAIGPQRTLWYAEHPVARGGGGGNAEFTETLPGSIGNYSTPQPQVIISHRGRLTPQGMIRIPISCGGAAEARCRGAARLRADGHLLGVAGFALPVGKTRDLVIRASAFARRHLARHPKVDGRLSLTVRFELRQEAKVALRSAPGSRGRVPKG